MRAVHWVSVGEVTELYLVNILFRRPKIRCWSFPDLPEGCIGTMYVYETEEAARAAHGKDVTLVNLLTDGAEMGGEERTDATG